MTTVETERTVEQSYEQEFISSLLNTESFLYYLQEGFNDDLLESLEHKAIWHFVKQYYEDSGRKSIPTVEVLEDEFPRFEFSKSNKSPHWLLDKLKYTWKFRMSQTIVRDLAKTTSEDPLEIFPYMKRKVFEAEAITQTERYVVTVDNIDEMTDEWLEELENGNLRGATLGFETIDSVIGGLRKSQLAFCLGKAGHGKSWMANVAWVQQRREGLNPFLATLELSTMEVFRRLSAIISGVSYDAIDKGYVDGNEIRRIKAAWEIEKQYGPLNFAQPPPGERKVIDFLSYMDRYDCNSLIVDQLEWIEPSRHSSEYFRDDLALGDVVMDLKLAAQRRDIPVYVMHQFGRQQTETGKLDMTKGARSAAVEKHADFIFGIMQDDELRDNNQLKFQIVKARSSQNGLAFFLNFELKSRTNISPASHGLVE